MTYNSDEPYKELASKKMSLNDYLDTLLKKTNQIKRTIEKKDLMKSLKHLNDIDEILIEMRHGYWDLITDIKD